MREFIDEESECYESANQFCKKLIHKIDRSLTKTIHLHAFSASKASLGSKNLAQSLAGRCHHLRIRNHILEIAKDAQKLVNSSLNRSFEDVQKDAGLLRERIDQFTKLHRPSVKDVNFIRFARSLIAKAENSSQRKAITMLEDRCKEVSHDSYELAERLYIMATCLYKGEIDVMNLMLSELPKELRQEVLFHISQCSGDLARVQEKKDRMKVIQGFLGCAHYLTDYYMGASPYPSEGEIEIIFQDLEHLDSSSV